MSTRCGNGDADADADEVCASCGSTGGSGITLKQCNACKLVKYCSLACQKEHRPEHKKACKKRVCQLREELLFRQPEESYLGDCPICFLPLPLDNKKFTSHSCCSKLICNGCVYVHTDHVEKGSLGQECPLCRTPIAETKEKSVEYLMKRFQANDPFALREIGRHFGREQKWKKAFDVWTKAADLGDAEAHFQLGDLYRQQRGVEKNDKQMIYHWEEAAIGGQWEARYNLAVYERNMFRFDKSVKHCIIAANLGYDRPLKMLKESYSEGFVEKEDFAAALRGYQSAVDATKSAERDKAEKSGYFDDYGSEYLIAEDLKRITGK